MRNLPIRHCNVRRPSRGPRGLVVTLQILAACGTLTLQACDDPPKRPRHGPDDTHLLDDMPRAAEVLSQRLDSAVRVEGLTIIAVKKFDLETTFGFPVTAPWHFECGYLGVELDIGAEAGDQGPMPDALIVLTKKSVSPDQCATLVAALADPFMGKMIG